MFQKKDEIPPPSAACYSNFFEIGGMPRAPDIHVASVEEKLKHHMENQSLGCPLESNPSVSKVLHNIMQCQGKIIQGDAEEAFNDARNQIVAMVEKSAEE